MEVSENQATVHSMQALLFYICIREALFAFDKATNCKYSVFKSFKIKLNYISNILNTMCDLAVLW